MAHVELIQYAGIRHLPFKDCFKDDFQVRKHSFKFSIAQICSEAKKQYDFQKNIKKKGKYISRQLSETFICVKPDEPFDDGSGIS